MEDLNLAAILKMCWVVWEFTPSTISLTIFFTHDKRRYARDTLKAEVFVRPPIRRQGVAAPCQPRTSCSDNVHSEIDDRMTS